MALYIHDDVFHGDSYHNIIKEQKKMGWREINHSGEGQPTYVNAGQFP